MKIMELAQWYDYVSCNETLLSINIVNFNMDSKILDFHMGMSFQIIDSLNFDKNRLFLCEKLSIKANSFSVGKGKYFYFMYNTKTGVFSWEHSDLIDNVTNEKMADKISKALDDKELNIENSFIGGSFIRESEIIQNKESVLKPYSYRGFIQEDIQKANLNKLSKNGNLSKSLDLVKNCIEIKDSLKNQIFQRS
ncbi:MAG: hypothetical protein JW974_01300 [Alphaproteobacteria bacterium]|nr:hypothetical protein [Alphaproteobacteria bacterium]MBN2675421.1 hypothetical protein [Alphaproteobacteria bacterium]